jgi:transposase
VAPTQDTPHWEIEVLEEEIVKNLMDRRWAEQLPAREKPTQLLAKAKNRVASQRPEQVGIARQYMLDGTSANQFSEPFVGGHLK